MPHQLPVDSGESTPAQALDYGRTLAPQKCSTGRRYVLLIIFCLAQFLDAFSNVAIFSALPALSSALDMSAAEATWVVSGFQLTFASFLLISGRISDVYNPKVAFIGGIAALGVLCIGAGFARTKIPLIVIRALSGIAAALTIPSALTLLVHVFTEPAEQARAIGVFGGCGAIGIVLGLVVGAIFVQYTSWSWVLWFVALVSVPIAVACIWIIPPQEPREKDSTTRPHARWKSLDLIGVSILTVALILFILAVTSGAGSGWGSARVLAPLIISVFMIAGFFYYETTIPPDRAAIPPQTWFLPNFLILFFTALLPFFFFTTLFTLYTIFWETAWQWSPISTATHLIPVGVLAFAISFTGALSRFINPKWIVLFGEGMCIIATILFALADRPTRYWSYIFPGFILGGTGTMLTYTHTNIAIFRTSPASMAGTVGAIFNGALQLGTAVGIAVVSSIESSIDAKHGGPDAFAGRAAAFWFMLAVVAAEFVGLLLFYRIGREGTAVDADTTLTPREQDETQKTQEACVTQVRKTG